MSHQPSSPGSNFADRQGGPSARLAASSAGWEGGVGGGQGQGPQVPGPPPTTNLILLATVHGDPAGYGRAWRFLEHWRPDAITVEISPFSVRYRERMAGKWRRRLAEALEGLPHNAADSLAVARAAAQASLPFEYRVARDWGRAHQIPVKLLDAGALARRHLPRYTEELLTLENLRLLSDTEGRGTLEEFVAREFQRARRAQTGTISRFFRITDNGDARRECLWARRLRRLVTGSRRIVHLGGWEHLVPWPDGRGLFHLLADLEPLVLLLEEAEQLC